MMKEPSNIKIYRGLLKKRKNLPNKQWKDNKITNIKGINFTKIGNKIEITLENLSKKSDLVKADFENEVKEIMADNWPLYLDSLREKLIYINEFIFY